MCKLGPEVIIEELQEKQLQTNSTQKQIFSLLTHSVRCCLQNLCFSKHHKSDGPNELMYCCIWMKSIKMVISLGAAAHLISRRRVCPGTSLCLCSSHRPLMNYLSKSVLWLHLVQFCVLFWKNTSGNTSKILTVICGSTCPCVLYNPLIWTEEGKSREQNMNGDTQLLSVLYSKGLIISRHPSAHLRRELSAMELCELG